MMQNLTKPNTLKSIFTKAIKQPKPNSILNIMHRNFSSFKNRFEEFSGEEMIFEQDNKEKEQQYLLSNVVKLCQSQNYNDNMDRFQNDLRSLGFEQEVPSFAYSVLIDQNLQENKLYETMNIMIDAFLKNVVLDIPLFEDVLVHFVSNNYAEGIPILLDIFRFQFIVPTINILSISKEAVDRKLIDKIILTKLIKNFHFRSLDKHQDITKLEKIIISSQKNMKKIFEEKQIKNYQSNSYYSNDYKPPKSHDFDPIFIENADQDLSSMFVSPEIIESKSDYKNPIGSDFNKFLDSSESRCLGYIKIFSKGEGTEEKPIKLFMEYMNEADFTEDTEDYSTDVDSSGSEDKI